MSLVIQLFRLISIFFQSNNIIDMLHKSFDMLSPNGNLMIPRAELVEAHSPFDKLKANGLQT